MSFYATVRDEDEGAFIDVAVRNGLLPADRAEELIEYSRHENLRPSDAALNLAVLEMHEIDAVKLLLNPSTLAPGYEITGLIGCGASGMVFRARQSALDRDVALKTINMRSHSAESTGKPRIQREAKAIARLQHPNIVAAYDSGFYQGRFCIAMEFVHGETLATYIQRSSGIKEKTVWQIARQVASALSHAAEFGVIHRDIKPANLLIAEKHPFKDLDPGVPMIKVADFGLALDRDETHSHQLTATGTTLGTPAYVAPEQLQDTHVDQRADIYSLGATVYHMLAGSSPCSGRSPMKTIIRKTIGDDRWRDELPKTVTEESRRLFLAMTEAEPDNRISDYGELLRQINATIELLDDKAKTVVADAPRLNTLGNDSGAIANDSSTKNIHEDDTLSFDVVVRIKRNAFYWSVAGMAVVMAAALSATMFFLPSDPISVVRWQTGGIYQPLFDGQSVPLYRQFGGVTGWRLGEADDGSSVFFAGKGATMTIPLLDQRTESSNVRLRIGVNLDDDSRAELFIGPSLPTGGQTGVVRLQNGEARFYRSESALKESSDGRFVGSVDLPIGHSDESLFQLVQIFRQADRVIIDVNGDDLGILQCEANADYELMIKCSEGISRFADVDTVELVAPETTDAQAKR